MKHLFLLIIVALSGCATLTGQNSNPNACQVWTDDPAQGDRIAVENDAAFYGAGCITGRFGCKWKEAKFDGDFIVVEGELASRNGKVATYKEGVFTQVLDGVVIKAMGSTLINQEKFEFQKDRVVYTVKYTGLAKSIARKDVGVINYFHTPNCTGREVALGVGFFLSGRK